MIFYSYVSLPEGTPCEQVGKTRIPLNKLKKSSELAAQADMGRNGAVMEFSKYASDAMSLSRDRYLAPKHEYCAYVFPRIHI